MEQFLLSETKDEQFSNSIYEIYLKTYSKCRQYPEYYKWLYGKAIPRILQRNKTGEGIVISDKLSLAAEAILKDDGFEKKICNMFVSEEYRRRGYGEALVDKAMEILDTQYPLITIPEGQIKMFQGIINSNHWKLSYISYKYKTPELVFNDPQIMLLDESPKRILRK